MDKFKQIMTVAWNLIKIIKIFKNDDSGLEKMEKVEKKIK